MQGDIVTLEPVTSASGTSQVERGSPRVYGVLFRLFDDLFDGLFYVLKAACCFPLAPKRSKSVTVNIKDTQITTNVNESIKLDKKDKPMEKKIQFTTSQDTYSSVATTVISKLSNTSNSSSWISAVRPPDIVQDNYDYIEYEDRSDGIESASKSKTNMLKKFFTKEMTLLRRSSLKRYVPQLKFRRRRRSNSVVRPSSSSEVMFSKSKIHNFGNKIFPHELAREMTLGPKVYPCLQSKASKENVEKSIIKPIKSVFEGKLKRTISFFNDIYETNCNK